VTNNLWYNTTGYIIRFGGEEDGEGANGYGGPSNFNVFANNTIVGSNVGAVNFMGPVFEGVEHAQDNYIFNNIIIRDGDAFTAATGGSVTDQYYSNNITGDIDTYDLDSLFVDEAGDDYHILDGSAADNAGVAAYLGQTAPTTDLVGVSRPQGGAYDIGCYEIYHGSGAYVKNYSEAAVHTDTFSRKFGLAKEHEEAAVHTDTLDRTGSVYNREYTETAKHADVTVSVFTDQTPTIYQEQLSESAKHADTFVREGSSFTRDKTDSAVKTDTLERSAVYNRTFTEAAVHTDTLEGTTVPPASNTLDMVGYVTEGIVGAETG
jgi:hypothetical protein